MAWQVVEFESDELERGHPMSLYQFNFDLMCAEVFKEADTGLWLATVIDTDGEEVWVSPAVANPNQAVALVRGHIRECFANWLNAMTRELP